MSLSTPACQLLARQPLERYRDGWLVAPVLDEALLGTGPYRLWCADHAIANAYRCAGHEVCEGLVAPPMNEAGALLFWPKTHALGQWWLEALCRALPAGAPLQIVGEHQGGIKRVPKLLEALGLSVERLDNARRCSLFATRAQPLAGKGDVQEAWISFEALGLTLCSHPGVFGHGKLDEGTRLLLEHLPELTGRVLDVGCGDGIIAAWLAARGATVTAVDVNHFALEAARRSLAANGLTGEVLASDMLASVTGTYKAIVTNPPFHQERSIDYDPTRRLIEQAASQLEKGGCLYLVANAFLPYSQALKAHFARVDVLADNRRFRVYRACNA